MANPSPFEEEIELRPSPAPIILAEPQQQDPMFFEEDEDYGPFDVPPSPHSSPKPPKN